MKESFKKQGLPSQEESAKNWEAFHDKMEMEMIKMEQMGEEENYRVITKDKYEVSGSDLTYMCPRCCHEQKEWGICEKCERMHGVSYWEATYNKRIDKAIAILLGVLIGLIIYGITSLWLK